MLAAKDNNILVAFLNIERHAQTILREHCRPTENYNGTADPFRIGNGMIVYQSDVVDSLKLLN
jgi:hypothetical protein